jgi:hypothetical protein
MGFVEGISTWLFIGDLDPMISMLRLLSQFHLSIVHCFSLHIVNDNSDGIGEIFSMFKNMMTTPLEMLSEHNLIALPTTLILNASVLTLLMIHFLTNVAMDFDVEDVGAIVKAADKVDLKVECRKEVGVTEEDLENLRESGGKVANWKKEVRFPLSFCSVLSIWRLEYCGSECGWMMLLMCE